jgi:hypothetical protein
VVFQVTVEWTAATSPPLEEVMDTLVEDLLDCGAAVGVAGVDGTWDAVLTVEADSKDEAGAMARRLLETLTEQAGQTGVVVRVAEVLDDVEADQALTEQVAPVLRTE